MPSIFRCVLTNLVAIVFLCLVQSANADEIPPRLQKFLNIFQIEESHLSDGVLRVRFSKPILTYAIYSGFVDPSGGICGRLYPDSKKDGWEKANIKRIELVNSISAQGFAFVGGRKSCMEMFPMNYDQVKVFIDHNTWVCVAGNPCRPRRAGEKTSGDD